MYHPMTISADDRKVINMCVLCPSPSIATGLIWWHSMKPAPLFPCNEPQTQNCTLHTLAFPIASLPACAYSRKLAISLTCNVNASQQTPLRSLLYPFINLQGKPNRGHARVIKG